MAGPQDQPTGLSAGRWLDVLDGDVQDVAPRLLGALLRHDSPEGAVAVRLTEVEAYGGRGSDPGSHAFRGPGRRNATMFGPPGRLYVYFTYGMHWCANVVCPGEGRGAAVLLRAGQVVEGVDVARRRRPRCRRDVDLARGPARLTAALAVSGVHDGCDLAPSAAALGLSFPGTPPLAASVRCGPRVGVSGAGGDGALFPWRFWLAEDPTVSAYRPGKPRRGSRPVSKDAPGSEILPAAREPDEGIPGP